MEYIEVSLTIDNPEIRANIENMAKDLQVEPERLMEAILCSYLR